ncbi:MAG: hypothetical protein MMC33_009573 [Icmadophila ericetorum]|nr:hypothetical protein [Icmadophila ericetorum]
MSYLLANLCYIIQDIYHGDVVPWKRYELHMTKLQLYLTRFPEELRNPTLSGLSDMGDRQRIVLELHLHTMRLGSIIILTRPLLLQTIATYRKQAPQPATFEFGVEEFAHIW